jgi:hypothetical protein
VLLRATIGMALGFAILSPITSAWRWAITALTRRSCRLGAVPAVPADRQFVLIRQEE